MELPGREAGNKISVRFFALCLLVLLVGTLLRGFTLELESIGSDELFSRDVAVSDLPEALEKIRQDIVHPPLYYLILKLTVGLAGAGVAQVRAPSMIFGIATIGLLLALSIRSRQFRAPALLAAALVAVNHWHIDFSNTARSYTLYTLLITLLLLWVFSLETHGNRKSFWVLGFALFVVSLYTHYISLLYLAGITLALLLGERAAPIRRRAAAIFAAACFLFLPWGAYIWGAYQQKRGLDSNLGWMTEPTLHDLKSVWAAFLGIPEFPGATTVSFCLMAGLVAAGIWLHFSRGDGRRRTVFLALVFTALVPPLALFVLSASGGAVSFFGFRHLLPSLIPSSLLACYGLWEASRLSSAPRALFAGGAVVLVGFGLGASVEHRWEGPTWARFDVMAKALQSPELQRVEAYATWKGTREPVNFYCGEPRVKLLDTDQDLPQKLVLLFRPTIETERAAFDRLVDHGYTVVDERKDGNYVVLVVMEQAPPVASP